MTKKNKFLTLVFKTAFYIHKLKEKIGTLYIRRWSRDSEPVAGTTGAGQDWTGSTTLGTGTYVSMLYK